jgi:hypothetical protein
VLRDGHEVERITGALSRQALESRLAIKVARQPTNPHPGPSLRVELVRRGRFHERSLAVRIEPTRG